MSEFDAYLMVDWSANSRPKRGKDSIWYCLLSRRNGLVETVALENPPTRAYAVEAIRDHLLRLAQQRLQTLVGFDFPYGFPSGFAAAAGLSTEERWRSVWTYLQECIRDEPDNRNNRFEVAAGLNDAISGQLAPFWGCPRSAERPCLGAKKPKQASEVGLPERRITEQLHPSSHPVWKLFTAGSVGSQALLGIPRVANLRFDPDLAAVSRVWPFETGLRRVPPRAVREWSILHAEVYPSLGKPRVADGEVKDAAQVRAIAEELARRDESEELQAWFEGPMLLSAEERERIQSEEGWILWQA
jgi:precorrin-8X/cobalt-precorrin-8 methylmutase